MNASLPTRRTIALSSLAPGARAVVDAVDASSAIGRRLLDLGFRPGTPVSVIRRAPLGDPTSYELRGSRFCLRGCEAQRITVVIEADASGLSTRSEASRPARSEAKPSEDRTGLPSEIRTV